MRVLFVHNNFPAQFATLATALSRCRGVEIVALGCESARAFPGVRVARYRSPHNLAHAHSFARRFDNEARRAEEVMYAANGLNAEGFVPDLIFVHPGWGEGLPLRAIFPAAKIVAFCEYWYRREGGDVGFDPEFPAMGVDGNVALEARNASSALALSACDAALAPTEWQKATYPKVFRPLIEVIHEGVDTDFFTPMPRAAVRLPDGGVLRAGEEIVTYATRDFEPIRGFHSFMRALPEALARRPRAHAVILGETGISYGMRPRRFPNWKEAMLAEVGERLDLSRVTFLPRLPYPDYLNILRVSAAHVYLTYPFVLSWSLLEAMSAGCLVIASDTAPVREVVDAGNGLLVPMFDIAALSNRIVEALARPQAHAERRAAARRTIVQRYDSTQASAPRLLALVERVVGRRLEREETFAPPLGPPVN